MLLVDQIEGDRGSGLMRKTVPFIRAVPQPSLG